MIGHHLEPMHGLANSSYHATRLDHMQLKTYHRMLVPCPLAVLLSLAVLPICSAALLKHCMGFPCITHCLLKRVYTACCIIAGLKVPLGMQRRAVALCQPSFYSAVWHELSCSWPTAATALSLHTSAWAVSMAIICGSIAFRTDDLLRRPRASEVCSCYTDVCLHGQKTWKTLYCASRKDSRGRRQS